MEVVRQQTRRDPRRVHLTGRSIWTKHVRQILFCDCVRGSKMNVKIKIFKNISFGRDERSEGIKLTVVKFIFRWFLLELGVTQFSSWVSFSLSEMSTDGSLRDWMRGRGWVLLMSLWCGKMEERTQYGPGQLSRQNMLSLLCMVIWLYMVICGYISHGFPSFSTGFPPLFPLVFHRFFH